MEEGEEGFAGPVSPVCPCSTQVGTLYTSLGSVVGGGASVEASGGDEPAARSLRHSCQLVEGTTCLLLLVLF